LGQRQGSAIDAVKIQHFSSGVFDGFSIGSNDLTQLTLGLDRDSSLVAHLFDERNDAVKAIVKIDNARSLTRYYERLPENHAGMVYVVMIRLMLRRLTKNHTRWKEKIAYLQTHSNS
jgi:signal transduction protein with GAF and PtsI domain